MARPLRAMFLRDDESEVESNSAKGKRVCVFVVATSKQPARDPDLVFLTLSGECGIAAALR